MVGDAVKVELELLSSLVVSGRGVSAQGVHTSQHTELLH